MSSAYVAHDQINDSYGFFRTVAALNGTGDSAEIRTVNAGKSLDAVMTSSTFLSYTTASSASLGNILRDMGKQVTIVDATTGLHTQVWRRVQLVSGAASEGVLESPTDRYVITWSASGTPAVKVARTG